MTKEPVLLTVLIETDQLRWYVAGISMDGVASPLIRSEPGNLSPYIGQPGDEQVSFLRHRLSGVLQRGCDRLWGRQKKPCQIVFVADAPFAQGDVGLTGRVAEHFVQWMTNPPVLFFVAEQGFNAPGSLVLKHVAGERQSSAEEVLSAALPQLFNLLADTDVWELAPSKRHPSE